MNYYVVEDSELAKRNKSLIGACGSGEILYNAVLEVTDVETGTEPILLPEAKNWCKLDDDTTDDALVTKIITAARRICEKHANLSFIAKTITARFVNGLGNLTLPYGPVTGTIAYTDFDGLAITSYEIRTGGNGGEITAVYTAGYATLPEEFRTAILCQIAWMYDNRGNVKLASALSLESLLYLNQVRSV